MRPSLVFPPRPVSQKPDSNLGILGKIPKDNNSEDPSKVRVAGAPFLPTFGKRPYVKEESSKEQNAHVDEVQRKETANANINVGIVSDGRPGNALSAEDSDPETRCKNTCGRNEICQINAGGGIECKCRPGFGSLENSSKCEKSRSYTIEVLTTSESREEITVIRLSPKAVQRAVDETFRNNFKDIYHGSEITSIRVGNDTNNNRFYGGRKNLTRDQDMSFNVLVHIAEAGNDIDTEEKLRSILESPIKDTKLPLGADVTVSRVSVADFDECSSVEHNDCSDNSECYNMQGSYTCSCRDGFYDLSGPDSLPGRVCSSATTECEQCSTNGKCLIDEDSAAIRCECRAWFAGRTCQINLKLLLIVGCVSVILMIVIACGVSCFCCRDRNDAKNNMPSPYGTSISRMPVNMGRQQGFMMDPHGGAVAKAKHPMKPTMIPRPGIMQKAHHMHYGGAGSSSMASMASHQDSLNRRDRSAGAWQSSLSGEMHHGQPHAQLVIPRAKMKPRGYNQGYNSDDDAEANRAVSEHNSMGSRHRRKSVPSFASNLLSGSGSRRSRSSPRAGSIDPLLDGSYSDGADSNGKQSSGTLHLSVSRGELDRSSRASRADTRSEARSYNETIIRPVTRRLNTPAGTSNRSSRSHATSEDGRTMAERDGGSSFVVSPRHHQLYRLHDSDGSLDSL